MIIASWLAMVVVIATWMPLRRRFEPRMHDIGVAVLMVGLSFLNAGSSMGDLLVSSSCGTLGTVCGWRALRGTST